MVKAMLKDLKRSVNAVSTITKTMLFEDLLPSFLQGDVEAAKLALKLTVHLTEEVQWLTWSKAVAVFWRTHCIYSNLRVMSKN